MIRTLFEKTCRDHIHAVEKSFTSSQLNTLEAISRELIKCLKDGRKIMLCGNGGSASDSQHIAAEFVGRFHRERRALPAIALTADTSIITAVANDYQYEDIFARQVEALGQAGDALIAISTSGNSKNVLSAVEKANEMQILTLGFTGEEGGRLAKKCKFAFRAASALTPHIQEVHITVLHAISEVIEKILFGS